MPILVAVMMVSTRILSIHSTNTFRAPEFDMSQKRTPQNSLRSSHFSHREAEKKTFIEKVKFEKDL